MFGKTQRGVSERSTKPKQSLVPKWLGTLVTILIIICIAVVLMLWKPWKPVSTQNEIPSPHYQDEDTNHDYRFYDLLPQQQVTPIPDQAIPETKSQQPVVIVDAPKNAASTPTANDPASAVAAEENLPAPHQTTYVLQVRSYPDPDSADARRAEIILNGLSADVVRSVENGKVWYRVVSGPYDTQGAAVAAQQTLQHSGIDSIIVRH